MGVYVDLYKFEYDKLVDELLKYDKIENKEMLERILKGFGEKCGDYYFLLNNEYYDEYNSYYEVANLINEYFGVEDSFNVFLKLGDRANCNKHRYTVAEELGIENIS